MNRFSSTRFDWVKATRQVALDSSDRASLHSLESQLPDDLVDFIMKNGSGNFCGYMVNLSPPKDYLAEALPDDSENPRLTYGGRKYHRVPVVGSVEDGFWIIAQDKRLFLFRKDAGIGKERPFDGLGSLLEYVFFGGLFQNPRSWAKLPLTPYFVSDADRGTSGPPLPAGGVALTFLKSKLEYLMGQVQCFWWIQEALFHFQSDRHQILVIGGCRDKRRIEEVTVIFNPTNISPSDELSIRMQRWVKGEE